MILTGDMAFEYEQKKYTIYIGSVRAYYELFCGSTVDRKRRNTHPRHITTPAIATWPGTNILK